MFLKLMYDITIKSAVRSRVSSSTLVEPRQHIIWHATCSPTEEPLNKKNNKKGNPRDSTALAIAYMLRLRGRILFGIPAWENCLKNAAALNIWRWHHSDTLEISWMFHLRHRMRTMYVIKNINTCDVALMKRW